MRVRHVACLAAVMLASVVVGKASVARGQHVSEFVPAQTALLVRFASVDRVIGGWNDLLGAIGAPATQAQPYTEMGVAEYFDVRTNLNSLDRTQPGYLGMMLTENLNLDPRFFLVKAKDETALRRAVLQLGADAPFQSAPGPAGFQKVSDAGGRSFFFGKAGEWVLYARSEEVAKALSDGASGAKLATLIDARSREIFDAGEASLFVNADAITTRFQNDIKQARQDADLVISQIASQIPPNAGDPEVLKKAISEAVRLGFDAVDDAKSVVASATFSSAGVGATVLATVSEGTNTDKLFVANPAAMIETLGNLPKDASVYYGVQLGKDLLKGFASAFGAGQFGSAVKDPKAYQEAVEKVAASAQGASTGSFSLLREGSSGMAAFSLTQTEDAEALRLAYRMLAAATGEIRTPQFTQSTEISADAESYKSKPIDVTKTKINLMGEGAEIGRVIVERLFGGSEMQARTIALDGVLAQATGRDASMLHKWIDSLESGEGAVGLEESYSQTRDKLAEKANLVLLFNAPQFVIDAMKLAREIPGVGQFLGQFNLSARPAASYAGLSINTEAQGLRVQAFVPASQPREILRIFAGAF